FVSGKQSAIARRRWLAANRRRERQGSAWRTLVVELLETRHLLADDWHNPLINIDINDDGLLTPFDASIAVRDLTLNGIRGLDQPFDPAVNNYLDATGDGRFTPQDVLAV